VERLSRIASNTSRATSVLQIPAIASVDSASRSSGVLMPRVASSMPASETRNTSGRFRHASPDAPPRGPRRYHADMIPLYDENKTRLTPILTISLIALNVLVFLWEIGAGDVENARRVFSFGAIPYNVTQDGEVVLRFENVLFPGYRPQRVVTYVSLTAEQSPLPGDTTQPVAPWMTLLTSMFLHGGWMHLIFNMLFLWVFANNVEDAMGHGKFLVFYLLTGLIATGVHIASEPGSLLPTIGASGAISGVLGAYLVLYPRARVLTLVPLGPLFFAWRLPAMAFLVIWFLIQIVNVLGTGDGGVAWYAHIGGFVAGVALVKLFESGEHREREPLGVRETPRFARRELRRHRG
jgi:membrane associated rhomboid family serine protease